jgi:hypothetical protein
MNASLTTERLESIERSRHTLTPATRFLPLLACLLRDENFLDDGGYHALQVVASIEAITSTNKRYSESVHSWIMNLV